MKNIAIISTSLHEGDAERLAALLSKKLSKLYHVYLFLLNTKNIVYEYGGTIVNVGGAGPFFEYSIKINKEKYKIDVAISFKEMINIANIRTRGSERVIILEGNVQLLPESGVYADDLRKYRYYDYADEIVADAMMTECENDKILDKWIEIIEKENRKNVAPIAEEMRVLDEADHIYIYGAGLVGKNYYIRLSKKYKIEGFVVSSKEPGMDELYGIPVFEIDDVKNRVSTAFIVGVSYAYQDEIIRNIKKHGFEKIVFPWIEPLAYDYYINCPNLDIKAELIDWSRLYLGRNFDIDNPIGFNEKIQWLKLYDNQAIKTKLADKVLVRDYIKEKIGEKYLIPCLGVWNSFDEIDWDRLPERFVLKCNHGSGMNAIIKDKKDVNYNQLRNNFARWMDINYAFLAGFEMHYSVIERKIIIEEYLGGIDDDIKDYKLMCFNGKVKCSFVCSERHTDGLKVTFFDRDWNLMPFERHYPMSKERIDRPDNYDKMIELAEILAAPFKFVRVDFYEVNNKVYFGELTFYPGSGIEEFTPPEWDIIIGNLLDL